MSEQRADARAVVESRHLRGWIPTPVDVPYLYELATSDPAGLTWRFRGGVPSPEEFRDRFWEQVLVQYVWVRKGVDRPSHALAHSILYGADHRDGRCYLGLVAHRSSWRTGLSIEAAVMTIDAAFSQWDMRKLYVEALSSNVDRFASALTGVFTLEGRLVDYAWSDGEYRDLMIMGLDRRTWTGRRERALRLVGAGSSL